MNDNYTHIDNKLVYITENIPGPKENSIEYEKLLDNYNSQYTGCICKEHCQYPLCKCIKQSQGTNYESTSHKLDFSMYIKTDDRTYPIFECTDQCPCSPICGNRVVQKGPIQGLTVQPCTQKGFGLFTTDTIPKGTFICEYAGEILTKSQALERTKENEEKNYANYIFCLNEHSSMITKQTFVDPSQFGNIGRYINHSCDPNSCIVPVRSDSLIPKLAIFACKDINANEEITFSYGRSDNLEKIYRTGKKCYCNTEKCQGFLPSDDFES